MQNVKRLVYAGHEADGSREHATREPCGSRSNAGGQWRAAGESGMPLVVTGKGTTMREAREQAYGRIDGVVIPNLYYRDDIGERWIGGEGDKLHAWGYLRPT